MRKIYIIFSLLFFVVSIANASFDNKDTTRARVIVIYPHFFNNTRSLISKIDSIINIDPDGEFFVYVSNELNPVTYFKRDLLFDLLHKLSFSYGNLVPNYSFDIENIIGNKHYQEIINKENNAAISYSFFIPKEYWDYINNLEGQSLNPLTREFGIIPKNILKPEKTVNVNLYFPMDTSPQEISSVEGISVNLSEI